MEARVWTSEQDWGTGRMGTVPSMDLEDALSTHLSKAGFDVYWPQSEELPAVVAADNHWGLLVIHLADDGDRGTVELNRRLGRLRKDIPEIARVPAQRLVVTNGSSGPGVRAVTIDEVVAGEFLGHLAQRGMDDDARKALSAHFAPRLSIEVPRRDPLSDKGAADRAVQRLVLDEEQSDIACRPVKDVMLLTGPPGSGKTLVLAARAKWLAREHPEWRIGLLCYNRALVPYLESLTWGHANISVYTVGRLASLLRVSISLSDEERAARDVARAVRDVRPAFDAILVDEWQDFMDAWTRLILAAVRPGRGGVTLAGDPKQALYRDANKDVALAGRTVEVATLSKPYRSTRQILDVTSALDPSMGVDGKEEALEGQPVDLVWAENVTGIADAVARDIQLLLELDERQPQGIGVLVTRKWDIGKVLYALKRANVPAQPVYPNKAAEFDLGQPVVKVMTVHSAKGYEFDVVFLVGMEHLADPDGTDRASREGRCGYVGSTRARDQLVLTYSKENVYLDRIRSLPEDLVQQWVWPDDYPEED